MGKWAGMDNEKLETEEMLGNTSESCLSIAKNVGIKKIRRNR